MKKNVEKRTVQVMAKVQAFVKNKAVFNQPMFQIQMSAISLVTASVILQVQLLVSEPPKWLETTGYSLSVVAVIIGAVGFYTSFRTKEKAMN